MWNIPVASSPKNPWRFASMDRLHGVRAPHSLNSITRKSRMNCRQFKGRERKQHGVLIRFLVAVAETLVTS
jgi:hypothetical protein